MYTPETDDLFDFSGFGKSESPSIQPEKRIQPVIQKPPHQPKKPVYTKKNEVYTKKTVSIPPNTYPIKVEEIKEETPSIHVNIPVYTGVNNPITIRLTKEERNKFEACKQRIQAENPSITNKELVIKSLNEMVKLLRIKKAMIERASE